MIDKDFKLPRLSTAQQHLFEKYAGWWADGTKEITLAVTGAKRMRTQLTSTAKTFEAVLPDEGMLAVKAAISTMSALIKDLEVVLPLAKRHAQFVDDKRAREGDAKLTAQAAARWTTDAEAITEAEDLVAFLANPHTDPATRKEVEAFIGAHYQVDRVCMPGVSGTERKALVALPDALKAGDAAKVRRMTVEVLGDSDLRQAGSTSNGGCAGKRSFRHVGLDDFQAWRAARAVAKSMTSKALAGMSTHPTT